MIHLQDNHFEKYAQVFNLAELAAKTAKYPHDVWEILCKYNGKTLSDLRRLSGGNLVVFGGERQEGENPPAFYSVTKNDVNNDIPEAFAIHTSNLMGVLRLRHPEKDTSLQMEIRSRFDSGKEQLFLNYLLSRVFQVDFFDLVSAGTADMLDVLTAIMLIQKLKEAIPVGLYKEYKKFEKNDLNFRGRLDLQRHIRSNYPVMDKIAYSYNEITFDNPLNHLLRSAVEVIRKKWPSLLYNDADIRDFTVELQNATPSWNANCKHDILRMEVCRESIRHPFFREYYEDARLLAKMLIEEEGVSVYDSSDAEVSGVIFDGAWLWEEYIAAVLAPLGFIHAEYQKKGAIPLFEKENIVGMDVVYPDFYSESRQIVLDTKYKRDTESREDIFQLLTYTFITGAEKCGLIYPPQENRKEHEAVFINQQFNTAKRAVWQSFAYDVPPQDMTEFCNFMREQEEKLQKSYKFPALSC